MDLISVIKPELEALPDSDKERFERIRGAQIAKHGKEIPEHLHGALHTLRRGVVSTAGSGEHHRRKLCAFPRRSSQSSVVAGRRGRTRRRTAKKDAGDAS